MFSSLRMTWAVFWVTDLLAFTTARYYPSNAHMNPRDWNALSVLESALSSTAKVESPDSPQSTSATASDVATQSTSALEGALASALKVEATRTSTPSSIAALPTLLCVPFADPDSGVAPACQCSGQDFSVPIMSGPSPCGYTTLPPRPTSTRQTSGILGLPYTMTAPNSAIVACESLYTNGGPICAGSSTTVHYGNRMTVQMASDSSVNVGTLTAEALYTAVSSALLAACTDTPSNAASASPTASAIECGKVPSIENIAYTDGHGNWYGDGELEIDIKDVAYFDVKSLQGIAAAIASSVNVSSQAPKNQWSPEKPECAADWCNYNTLPGQSTSTLKDQAGFVPANISNIPAFVEAILTQDTLDAPGWPVQHMAIGLTFEAHGGTFLCADGALISDGLAALALLPGLEWLDFMAVPALGVSVACDSFDHLDDTKKG